VLALATHARNQRNRDEICDAVRLKGRRVTVYVPEELVPEVQRSLDNGRALQELLQQAAPRYIKALKRERTKASKTKKN